MNNSVAKYYIQPAFLLCVAVLAAAGGGMSAVKSYLGVQMIKRPLPLRKPLDLIDERALVPYKVLGKAKIQNQDVLESLGTRDYIEWTLEDTEAESVSLLRHCLLFITYYTGTPDQVPHVPEECYFGGGSQRFSTEDIAFEVNLPEKTGQGQQNIISNVTKKRRIPARCLLFGNSSADFWQKDVRFPVLYCFKVNGVYSGNRTTTRLVLMSNITGKYSYFAKIEWQFYNIVMGSRAYPEKDQAIAASNRLLSVLLPVLERDHWPDWDKAMAKK